MADRVLLVGMMGAGKSSVGRRLAARLRWPYVDSDAQVEQAKGRTVREIFAAEGEAAFRAAERQALLAAVGGDGPAVVSVAGGAVLDPRNRQAIVGAGFVVWLRASVETLARRVGDGTTRPLLGEDPRGALERLLPVREPLYAEVADAVVDVDGRPLDAIVRTILELRSAAPA